MKSIQEITTIGQEYPGAKSVCTCTHDGDGKVSAHSGINGNGPCRIKGCGCPKFTWKRWTDDFEALIK